MDLERLLREEEERRKERRRSQLRQEIAQLSAEIQEANNVINDLSQNSSYLARSVSVWRQSLTRYHTSDITSRVTIRDRFEGVISESFAKSIPEAIRKMEGTCQIIEGVKAKIGSQIQRIREYISKLEQNRASLQAELASI